MELSRKRKPLGPRQRLAYIKPFIAALEAAKGKVAEARASAAAAELAWGKAVKRFGLPIVRTDANGGRHEVGSLAELQVYGLSAQVKDKGRAKVRKAIVSGEYGVQIGTGTPKAPNAVRRIRLMAPADVRKRARLQAKLAAAQKALADHVIESWTAGTPMTVEKLADSLIGLAIAKGEAFHGYIDEWAIKRAESSLEDARKHDGTASCPCMACTAARDRAAREKRYAAENVARAKAEAKRLAKLGTVTFTCPECGEVNEKAQVDFDGYEGEKMVECSKCETGHLLVDVAPSAAPVPGQVALVA